MKKIISLILILVTVVVLLPSCGTSKDSKEQSAQNQYIELINSFRESEIYKTAFKYVEDYLKSIYDSTEYDIAIEPGKLAKEDFDKYADFSTNAETRLNFFDNVSLVLTMSCKDTNYDQKEMADAFAKYGISGKLYDPATSRSYFYVINGREKSYTMEYVPEA